MRRNDNMTWSTSWNKIFFSWIFVNHVIITNIHFYSFTQFIKKSFHFYFVKITLGKQMCLHWRDFISQKLQCKFKSGNLFQKFIKWCRIFIMKLINNITPISRFKNWYSYSLLPFCWKNSRKDNDKLKIKNKGCNKDELLLSIFKKILHHIHEINDLPSHL